MGMGALVRGAAHVAALAVWMGAAVAVTWLAGCGGGGVAERDAEPGVVGILGANGRLIGDGERYWLPLDHAWPRPLYEPVREAMAVTNGGPGPIVVEALWIRAGDGATEGELTLVEPGGDRALGAGDRRLTAGEQLDFDVLFAPTASGLRAAELVVRTRDAADRVVELAGLGDGAERLVAERPLRDTRRLRLPGPAAEADYVRAGDGWVGLAPSGDGGLLALRVAAAGAWARRLSVDEAGPACVAASDAGVWVVAAGLRVVALGHDGALRWSRRFGPGGHAPVACAVSGDRLVVASLDGGAVDLAFLDAARGEAVGRWRLTGPEPVTRALVALPPSGGALVALEGTAEPPVVALARAGGLAWAVALAGHEQSPDRVTALVAVDDDGAAVLLGDAAAEGDASRVVRVRGSGGVAWEARLDVAGATLAQDATRLVVVGERRGGVVAVGLERGSGRLGDVRMLLGPGKRDEHPLAAHLGGDGLAVALGAARDSLARHWYAGQAGLVLRALDGGGGARVDLGYAASPAPVALGPGPDVVAADGLVAVTRPLDATLTADEAVVETLPWP